MTTTALPRTGTTTRPRARRALWTLQVLLALFMIGASALPKLLGESYAVEIFDDIGVGQWLRYVVGALELAGGIGLLLAPLAGLAAACFVALMVGAALTQVLVLQSPVFALTPVVLGVLFAVVARARWDEVRALVDRVTGRG